MAAAAGQQLQSTSTTAASANFEAAIRELKEDIKKTSARPGYHRYKSILFKNNNNNEVEDSSSGGAVGDEDEVMVVHDPATQEQVALLRKSILNIRRKILRISQQFRVPFGEVLARAVEKHKQQQHQHVEQQPQRLQQQLQPQQPQRLLLQQQQPQPQQQLQLPSLLQKQALLPQVPVVVTHLLLPQQPDVLQQQQPQQQARYYTPMPDVESLVQQVVAQNRKIAPKATVTAATAPAVLQQLLLQQSPVQPQQQQPQQPQQLQQPPQQPLTTQQSREEERMLRYGKAILKLKQYRRNLKYAVWDFQDGKDFSESCSVHKIPEEGLKYTIDLIVRKSGLESVERFRAEKGIVCDEHLGPKSPEYVARLRDAVAAFKQHKCASLFANASQNQVSLFDLIDELTKELEIESKIVRLTPVEPSQLPTDLLPKRANSNMEAASSATGSSNNLEFPVSDSEASSILSDIDEVIRDDTSVVSAASTVAAVVTEENLEAVNVIMLNICGVCHRIFTDEAVFKEHEAAGCIDFEI